MQPSATRIETGVDRCDYNVVCLYAFDEARTPIRSGYRYVPGAAATLIETRDNMKTLEDRLEALRQAGLIQWSGRKLKPVQPAARVQGEKTVAEIIVEDRR